MIRRFIRRLLRRTPSGMIARERLQILLVTDRIGCNEKTTECIKNDLISVISKYIEIDTENCIVEINHEKRPYLMANIPIKEVKL